MLKLSAITVAGQWRILTALPNHQMQRVISEGESEVKKGGLLLQSRIPGFEPG
jgi:hypothetical protein